MPNATDYFERAIGNALFLGEAFPTITQWTIHLYTTLPNPGFFGSEVIGGTTGYQPVRYDPGPDRWYREINQDDSGNTVYKNLQIILFPKAITNWGFVQGFCLKDQGGNICYTASLSAPQDVKTDDTLVFLIGELQMLIG